VLRTKVPHFSVFQRSSCCPARPGLSSLLQFGSPSGHTPEGRVRHLSMRTPLLRISCRLAHSFRRNPRTPKGPNRRVMVRIQGFSPSLRFAPPSASQVYFALLTPFDFPLQGFPLLRSSPNFRPDDAVMPFFRGCAPVT